MPPHRTYECQSYSAITMNATHLESQLPKTTLGLFIRDKRMALRISLRAFAEKLSDLLAQDGGDSVDSKFSPGFLSDIENGRRFPSDRVMEAIAEALGIDKDELREKDQRMPTDDLQRLQMLNPQFGFAFRRAVDYINRENLSPQEVVARIYKKPSSRAEE